MTVPIVAAALAVTFVMTARALRRRWDWRVAVLFASIWAAWLAWQALGRRSAVPLALDATLMAWWACVACGLYPARDATHPA